MLVQNAFDFHRFVNILLVFSRLLNVFVRLIIEKSTNRNRTTASNRPATKANRLVDHPIDRSTLHRPVQRLFGNELAVFSSFLLVRIALPLPLFGFVICVHCTLQFVVSNGISFVFQFPFVSTHRRDFSNAIFHCHRP